jgi:hypothetical protein
MVLANSSYFIIEAKARSGTQGENEGFVGHRIARDMWW